MRSVVHHTTPGVAKHYDFGKVQTLMDVGGGHGTLLNVILQAHPHLKGMLFDLPHVVAGAHEPLAAAGLTERCAVLSGDVFVGVPKGADARRCWKYESSLRAEPANSSRPVIRCSRRRFISDIELPDGSAPS